MVILAAAMSDRPHYPPAEPFYRQQRTDLKKFDENYQAIDWSRKREKNPIVLGHTGSPAAPETFDAFGTPGEPAAGWGPITVPLFPVLVACHTNTQLQTFCRSHMLRPWDTKRIRQSEDIYGFREDRPIYLLPDWWQGTEQRTIPSCKARGWKTIAVTEAQVLDGTTFSAIQRAEQDTRSIEKETND